MRARMIVVLSAAASVVAALACSNNGASCPNPGGPISAAPDNHCVDDAGAPIVQPTNESACHPDAGPDGGASTDYGPPMDNASADDDDCKYHITWTSTPVCETDGVTFTVTVTKKTDGSPLTGAGTEAEAFLSLTHPAPTPVVQSTEGPPGTYTLQPVRFDAPGDWTLRFHFREDCLDLTDDSPHGHAAFFVHVP